MWNYFWGTKTEEKKPDEQPAVAPASTSSSAATVNRPNPATASLASSSASTSSAAATVNRSNQATAAPRPVKTFHDLYLAIDIICQLKEKTFGGRSLEIAAQSTKISILQALMSKSGHENIAKTANIEELQLTLNELSEDGLNRIDADGEIGQNRRVLLRRALGVMLANDAEIKSSLHTSTGYSETEIVNLLMDGDYGQLFAILEAMGIEHNNPAMIATKAYVVSAQTLLDEMKFGLLEKLDFIFPNEIRLVPLPASEPELSMPSTPRASTSAIPEPPPLPPTAEERAMASFKSAKKGMPTQVHGKEEDARAAFSRQNAFLSEIRELSQRGESLLRHIDPAKDKRPKTPSESEHTRHLRLLQEQAAKRNKRIEAAQKRPEDNPSSSSIKHH